MSDKDKDQFPHPRNPWDVDGDYEDDQPTQIFQRQDGDRAVDYSAPRDQYSQPEQDHSDPNGPKPPEYHRAEEFQQYPAYGQVGQDQPYQQQYPEQYPDQYGQQYPDQYPPQVPPAGSALRPAPGQAPRQAPRPEPRKNGGRAAAWILACLLYTSPSPRDLSTSRMPSSA